MHNTSEKWSLSDGGRTPRSAYTFICATLLKGSGLSRTPREPIQEIPCQS